MPDLTLDLKYLKYAILVAEAGSFRRASERIAIAQSTVSRRVQLLERQLGTPLFERTRTGSRLTPEGRRFLQQAAIGARYLSEAAIEIHSGRGSTVLLKIGILASFPVGAVAGLLGLLRERHSTINVKLEESTAQSNVAAVLQGRQDAAVVLGSCSVVWLEAYQLGNEIVYRR
jgi:DNA-binding transcriptional LysR family regulator